MTFAMAAYCSRTGKLGVCQTTSTPAVGSKSARVVPGHGAVVVQARTNFATIDAATALLAQGRSAREIMARLREIDEFIDFRQVAVIRQGEVELLAGSKARDWAGCASGTDYAALCNVVCGPQVLRAMTRAFEASQGEELEERLLLAIEAGRDAGGEANGQHSSILVMAQDQPFPLIDLRVDMSAEPVGELRKLHDWYRPLVPYYVRRNGDPTTPPWRDFLRANNLPVTPW